MKARLTLAFSLACLPGCQPGSNFDITVVGASEVSFALSEELRGEQCINSLTIYSAYESSKPVIHWNVRNQNHAQVCQKSISFPRIPEGFEGKVSATTLPAGKYTVLGEAGLYRLYGDFEIPSH